MIAFPTSIQAEVAYNQYTGPYMTTGISHVGAGQSDTDKKWTKAIWALRWLVSLEDDWDGQGAEAPPLEVIGLAVAVAENCRKSGHSPPATAAATPAGTVLFTWYEGSIYTELEVVSADRLEWMQTEPGKKTIHGDFRLR